ncbi:ATP-dependent helicase HrpB [Amylibacter sp. SFDW26]|uniref:ATP-dependent helicase HrpB n=1 Tax=Amylibacter sp. SFDW26 TaxID=2652722 RepID=UPI00126256AB|nr:ATP-dependent helicase HrpB [Amylibacter sp. SFDW26]KAB7616169.1 ATP-dependent helicase HrpB [Amylibacter sp. SFDW26]
MSAVLPIEAALPDLLAALQSDNQAVLQAPPGAGKTTRIPLFLLEQSLFDRKILMLEPRRLAARAAAERMADILGEPVGKTVGYRMRGDNKSSANTKIEVVTEGILTRMIQSNPELPDISCVIFDEFHERSLQADLGLALSLEIRSALREDLCIIAMSATLDAAPVAKLMGDAPIVTSMGKSYPVEQRFLSRPWAQQGRKGPRLEDATASLIKTAISETEGGVLVFLPGAGEINRVQQLLGNSLGSDVAVKPLYGAMPFKDQRAAIEPPKSGRKVVLATSIAETSLTIPDIRVVVDAGRARRAQFDGNSGMSRLVTQRVTKAEATQREGRAGRVAEGVCYKLWTKGENGGMAAFPEPEIRSTDLTGLVLELALWGTNDPTEMAFLSPPRENDFATAQNLLHMLGALDDDGRITDYGRKLATQPTHARLAHVLMQAGSGADLLAALLEARDPLVRENRQFPSDLTLRWEALRDMGKFHAERPYKANRITIDAIKKEAKRLKPQGGKSLSLGAMCALAYPDRIGLRRKGDAPRYLLSGGKGAVFELGDSLANQRMIVATDLDGDAKEARIRLAVALPEEDFTKLYGGQIEDRKLCIWNKRDRRVDARIQKCFQALVLEDHNWKDCPADELAAGMVEGVRDLGLSILPMSKAATLYRARVQWLADKGADVPNLSDETLLDTLETWLQPHLSGMKKPDDLKHLDMTMIIKGCLSWEEQQRVDQLAPAAIKAPTGTTLAIDYSGEQPSVSVRLQELFGLTQHPCVGPDRLPLLINLLSPAQRPVQMTADLPNFWKTSYGDVRKDMRGRYPKHPWPEDPTVAEPTRRVKPRKN